MKTQSAKAKGRRFQQEIAATIKGAFPHLRDNDVISVSMGAGGEDIVLSPAAEAVFRYSVECKNVERLNIWSALEQASGNAPRGKTPIVAIRKNRQAAQAVIPWEHFMDLVKFKQDHTDSSDDIVKDRADCDQYQEDAIDDNKAMPKKRARCAIDDGIIIDAIQGGGEDVSEHWLSELHECTNKMQMLLHQRKNLNDLNHREIK